MMRHRSSFQPYGVNNVAFNPLCFSFHNLSRDHENPYLIDNIHAFEGWVNANRTPHQRN